MGFLFYCVVLENIHAPPPPTEGICRMTPPSPLDFPKSAPKIYPPPLRNFQNFRTPPGNVAFSN